MLLCFKDQKLQENAPFSPAPAQPHMLFKKSCYFGKRTYLAFERFSLCGVEHYIDFQIILQIGTYLLALMANVCILTP